MGGVLRRMSHGPQHFESNNWQGKGCRSVCRITQSTSRGPNRTRFLAVQAGIRAKMQCDKKSLLTVADASKQRNLMVVGGHSDNDVDLCGEDNVDAKRQCLGDNADAKRQCLGVKSPSETRYGSRVTMSERMINTKRIYDMAPV